MKLNGKKRPAPGFTLIELIVVVCAVALLSGVLLNRVLFYQEMAEKVAMQQTLTAIRTSLYLQSLNLIAKKRAAELPQFAEQNPMDWLAEKPENYAGDLVSMGKENVASGHWYFDSMGKKLVYLVHNGKNFRPDVDPKQMIYGIRILRGEAAPEGEESTVEGVILEQLNSSTWFK